MGSEQLLMTNNTTFTWEPVAYLLNCGLHALGYRHWIEGVADKRTPYDPNWEEYQNLEKQNAFRILAVRHNGDLIGYAGVRIFSSLQSREVLCGYIQEYYVAPEFRRGTMAGLGLFREIERQLIPLKVNMLSVGDRDIVLRERGGLGRFFKLLGYRSGERLWFKPLGIAHV